MRKIFLFLVICVLASCTRNGESKDTSIPSNHGDNKRVGLLIDSLFLEMPNAINNDVTREIFADSLKAKFQKYCGSTLPYITDLIFVYEGCELYPLEKYLDDAGKYLVYFKVEESKSNISDNCLTGVYVFGVIEKEDMVRLVDNKEYILNGTFRDFANNSRKTGFVFPDGKCLTAYPSLDVIDSKTYLYLGGIVLDNLTFTPINNGNN